MPCYVEEKEGKQITHHTFKGKDPDRTTQVGTFCDCAETVFGGPAANVKVKEEGPQARPLGPERPPFGDELASLLHITDSVAWNKEFNEGVETARKNLTWNCRFHPTNWWHTVGCPHQKWTVEQLQSALEGQMALNEFYQHKLFGSLEARAFVEKTEKGESPVKPIWPDPNILGLFKKEYGQEPPKERPLMTSNSPGEKCPSCGAEEVEADSPRTVYACGSSDYACYFHRPGSFTQSQQCKERVEELQLGTKPSK